MAKPAVKPRKKANGYKMPEPLPNGLILEDLLKKKWKLGPSIGKGGFGEIYSAQEYTDSQKNNKTFPYVIKIEPHENGPLFVEMHFYMRSAKSVEIESFKTEHKLPALGMPEYLGSGSHEYNGQRYRFVIMKKFGTDIWKLYIDNKRRFPIETAYKLTVQILDVLQYIHSKGYIHADVKGANILLGTGREAQNQVYLVDFGLCTHYVNEFKPDPKKAHNGTIEYLSRDAHQGVESRRGDLEMLGYNMIQWLGCTLPWERDLSNPNTVYQNKEKHMTNLPDFFQACFGEEKTPDAVVDYFKYVNSLKVETNPDYKKLRKILISGLQAAGGSLESPLKFKSTDSTPGKRKAGIASTTPKKKAKVSPKKLNVELSPDETVVENGVKSKAGTKKKVTKKPKAPKKADKLENEDEDSSKEENTGNYTAEMLRIKNKMKDKKKPVTKKSDRALRDRKKIDYREGSLGALSNVSAKVISDSEEEEAKIKTSKNATPQKKLRK